jgi:hypothetical protein
VHDVTGLAGADTAAVKPESGLCRCEKGEKTQRREEAEAGTAE